MDIIKKLSHGCTLDCHDCCKFNVYTKGNNVVKIEGDKNHPYTKGFICKKGMAHLDRLNHKDRIKTPMLKVDGVWKEISFDKALDIVKKKKIIYAPDATMQAMLSDKKGRVLIIEPGIGYRYEQENFSLITNYSILKPDITKPYIVSGDTRYEVAKELLAGYDKDFSVNDAFKVLKSVSQKDLWATRVSFVYSTEKNKVYYVLNNDFSNVFEFQF